MTLGRGEKNWSFWLRLLSCALNTLEKSQLFRCFCWFFILMIEDLSDTFRYSNATRQLNRLNPFIPRSTNDWPISKLIVFNWWLHSVGEKDMIRFRCRSLCGLIFVAVIICQGCWDWTPGSFNSASLRPLGRIYRDSLLFLRLLDSFNTHAEVFPPRSTTIAAAEGEHKKTEGEKPKIPAQVSCSASLSYSRVEILEHTTVDFSRQLWHLKQTKTRSPTPPHTSFYSIWKLKLKKLP